MLKSGDVLFVRAKDALERAIAESGDGRRKIFYAHTAIMKRDASGRLWVIHAIAGNGVTRERLPRFLARMEGQIDVYRATRPFDAARVLRRAESQIGQPYNGSYDPAERGWYCSDFVEYAFHETKWFHFRRMRFGEKGTRLYAFWRLFYKKQGKMRPVGKPGISPNHLVTQGNLRYLGRLAPAKEKMEEKEIIPIYGEELDECGRCRHYHTERDIAALKCGACGKYYACYHCHDELEDHTFVPTGEEEKIPVLCGRCRHLLTYDEYESGSCPYCGGKFNPGCKRHHNIYFRCGH